MNMNKEYRAEIRLLKRNLKKVQRDDKNANRQLLREHAQHEAAQRRIETQLGRQQKRVDRMATKITSRILILEGRLS